MHKSILLRLFAIYLVSFLVVSCGSDEDASRIVLGTSNSILTTANGLQYQDPFVVQVTDVDGNAAPYSVVTIKVIPLQYFKGFYTKTDTTTPADGTLDEWVIQSYQATCDTEDLNLNGFLEPGEDINNNLTLEPTNSATVTPHPSLAPTINTLTGRLVTDETGFGYFALTYPTSEANWVHVRVTATATVAGSEETEVYEYTLPVADSDVSNTDISPPGGASSKYGTAIVCTDPD